MIGPAAVTLAVHGPDGAIEAVGPAPLNEHERSEVVRALAIERTRRAADLNWQPTCSDMVESAATGAADAIKASLWREEDVRLREMDKASRALVDSKRDETTRMRAAAKQDLKAHEARQREMDAAWERQHRAAQDRIAATEAEYRRARTELAKAHDSDIAKMEQRCHEVEKQLSAARADAQRLLQAEEKALAMPRYRVDTSDIEGAEAAERERMQQRLRALEAEERRLAALSQEEEQQWQGQRAAKEQEQRGLLARVDAWRQKIRADSREALNALDREARERGDAAKEREQGLKSRMEQLRSTISDRERRVRELEGGYQRQQEEAMRQRSQLASEIAALERQREDILARASSDRARLVQEKQREIDRARDRANRVLRDAEEALVRARHEVSVAARQAVEAREEAVVRGGELGVCVEVQEKTVLPATAARVQLQEAIGVEDRVQNVRVKVPHLVRETVHISAPGGEQVVQVDAVPPKKQEKRGFFGRMFGGWGRAEAATMILAHDEEMLSWHMHTLTLAVDRRDTDTETDAESEEREEEAVFTDEE